MRNSGQEESHQLKRQRGRSNSWSLRNLAKEGVLAQRCHAGGHGPALRLRLRAALPGA